MFNFQIGVGGPKTPRTALATPISLQQVLNISTCCEFVMDFAVLQPVAYQIPRPVLSHTPYRPTYLYILSSKL